MLERVARKQGNDLVGARQTAMRALIRRKRRDVFAEQSDLTGVRPHVAADLVEQRGLPGAVGADDQPPLTGLDRKRHALRDLQAAERLVQADDLKRKGGCGCGHDDRPRKRAVSFCRPGTMPVGITSTMKRNTRPSSMFQRSILAE